MSETAPSYVDQKATEAGALDLNKIEFDLRCIFDSASGEGYDAWCDDHGLDLIAEIRRLRELAPPGD